MTDQTATAHQLYPTIRTDAMNIDRLNAVLRLALADTAETNHTCIYDGMDRADTIATAQRTVTDVMNALHGRAIEEDGERFTLALYGMQR